MTDWSKCPAVESVPGKVSGNWVFKDTRLPVYALFENLESGATVEEFMEWFEPVDEWKVRAVLQYVRFPEGIRASEALKHSSIMGRPRLSDGTSWNTQWIRRQRKGGMALPTAT